MGNWWAFGTAFSLAALAAAGASGQQVLRSMRCETIYNGVQVEGQIQVEDWTAHHGTHRLYGLFFDPQQNRYEFEVFTNQMQGGVGGFWMNNMRHREIHVQVQMTQSGFVIRGENGATAVYQCR